MTGLRFDGIKESENLKLVRSLPNLFRDEFLVRVQSTIYGENIIIRLLGSSVSMANNKYETVGPRLDPMGYPDNL